MAGTVDLYNRYIISFETCKKLFKTSALLQNLELRKKFEATEV